MIWRAVTTGSAAFVGFVKSLEPATSSGFPAGAVVAAESAKSSFGSYAS